MKTARTWAVALTGVEGRLVEVEADISQQTPAFVLIGLPDKALGEAVQRVHNACANSGLPLPRRRLTVNLSPASLPKNGSGFDLAIAVAALATERVLDPVSVSRTVHIGELGLDGRLRPVPGVLPAVFAAVRQGAERVIVPRENQAEAELVPGIEVQGASSLAHVAQRHGADVEAADPEPRPAHTAAPSRSAAEELADVVGQPDAVGALVLAAAGNHNLLLSGPPGAGKTMLARRLPGILPALSEEHALEVATIRSLAGEPVQRLDPIPPLEAPHHSASLAALVGGGSRGIRPGAVARAHRGVLFLDEAGEFPRTVLDALRQPLEHGTIAIHRAGASATFPARFQLVLATNPCPCGAYGVRGSDCVCPPAQIRRYQQRLSGPLRDRIDIDLHVRRVSTAGLQETDGHLSTADAREIVTRAREVAGERLSGTGWSTNAEVEGRWLRQGPRRLPTSVVAPLERAVERGALTLRGYDRALRLAWTLADVAGTHTPTAEHVARALFLRQGVSP